MLNLNSIIFRSEDLIDSDVDGETVLLSINNGKYYGFNSTSTRIWSLLQSPNSVLDICQILIEEFMVEPEQCRQDVLDFLNHLMADNLVQRVDE